VLDRIAVDREVVERSERRIAVAARQNLTEGVPATRR
jgi:hypothetical protein